MASPASQPILLRFGPFELDPTKGELRKAGIALKIHPQPFQVLLLLTEHAGQIVTRAEIQQSLWGVNTFVDFDRGINFCINQLRIALADNAESPRYIETIPRRGYRFIAPVEAKPVQLGAFALSSATDISTAKHPTELPLSRHAMNPPAQDSKIAPVIPFARSASHHFWSKRTVALAIAILPGVLALVVASYLRYGNSPKLTEKDTVVLADFSNTTGDPVFDDTLKQGFAVQLEQSPFLSILSDQKVGQTLKLMGQTSNAPLTPPVAREVCERTASKAYFTGSIANLNRQYVIGLNAVNCQTGDSLARIQVTAQGKENVLGALSAAATKLRKNVGESVETLQKLNVPIEQATTPSLPALQLYSLGRQKLAQYDSLAAVPLFQRAIQLDPQFAMAYASLGAAYWNLAESELVTQNEEKAYALRNRTSEPEKLYIEAHYNDFVTGDLNRARETYELWTLTYPRDPVPAGNLGPIYGELGEHEKRLAASLRVIQLDPASTSGYAGAAGAYIALNRFDEARAVLQQAQAKGLDSYPLRFKLYELAFCKNDDSGMAQQVKWAEGKPAVEDLFLNLQALTAAYFGKMKEARELYERAAESAKRSGEPIRTGLYSASLSFNEADFGDFVRATQAANAALAEAKDDSDLEMETAMTFAKTGDANRAEKIARDLAKKFPEDTVINEIRLPILAALIELDRGNPQEALDSLEKPRPYELGLQDGLYSAYVRGLAYLRLRKGAEAAGEFQKIVNHPGIVLSVPIGALAHVQLARAFRMQGNAPKAHDEYARFLALWKSADPALPILQQAKTEYASLHD